MTLSRKSEAPWTERQVMFLERRQAADWLHPYTCGKDSRHGNLVPLRRGWVCNVCDYQQSWAHESDTEGRFLFDREQAIQKVLEAFGDPAWRDLAELAVDALLPEGGDAHACERPTLIAGAGDKDCVSGQPDAERRAILPWAQDLVQEAAAHESTKYALGDALERLQRAEERLQGVLKFLADDAHHHMQIVAGRIRLIADQLEEHPVALDNELRDLAQELSECCGALRDQL